MPLAVGANVGNVLGNLRLFEYLLEETGSRRESPFCALTWIKATQAKLYVAPLSC